MDFKKFRVPIVLFLLALFLNIYGIWWGLPNYYTWSIDDTTPTDPLLLVKSNFKHVSEYPMFHHFLLFFVYSPYLAYLYFSGGLINPHQGFPYGFTDPLASLTILMLLARFVSAIMGALIVVFVYLSVKTMYGRKAALFSALSVALSYIVIEMSHFGNLDIPYTFWFTIALYSYVKLIKTYETKYYILFGLFTGLAAATKEQISGFFMLLPIPLLYFHFKHHVQQLGGIRTVFNKKLLYCMSTLFITYALAANIIFNFEGYLYRIHWLTGSGIERSAQFPNTFLGQLQLFEDAILQLKYSTGIALFLLLLIGFLYCLYKFDDYTFAFLVPLISYYIFDIARINYLYYRMTIPIIIVLSFFAGRFLSDLIKNFDVKRFIYPLLILVLIYSFLYGFSADLSMVYDSRHSAEKWMVKNIDKNSRIEVYHNSQYLPRFHALGFENVSMVFLDYNGTEKPPVLIFEPVIDSSGLESLKARNPDYIIIAGARYEDVEYVLLPEGLEKKKMRLEETAENKKIRNYLELLLSEKLGYKIVKIFDNQIPFAPETPLLNKRTNLPVIILKKE